MKNKGLAILLIVLFTKSLAWMFLTPIFQVPDEPSHFSIVQYIGQTGKRPHPRRERPSSLEILKASEAVNFNWQIKHPVWQGYQADWQQQLSSISNSDKSSFTRNHFLTSLKRPPLYYYLASPFYLLFSGQSFIFRFFSVRFFSLLLGLLTALYAFKAAKLFFKNKLLPLAVTSLVGFQPMLSFIGISAHYDPLAVFISTTFSYYFLSFLKTRNKKFLRLSLLLSILGLLTKPDLIVLIIILGLFSFRNKLKPLSIGVLVFFSLSLLFPVFNRLFSNTNLSIFLDKFVYLINLNEYSSKAQGLVKLLTSSQILTQLTGYFSQTFTANLAQVFPWYWGVFGWLEKTMPMVVYQILKLTILLSLVGYLKILVKKTKLTKFVKQSLVFLASFSLLHLFLVILNDFITFTSSGQIFGFQGRYLLPAIFSHTLLLVFGFSKLVPKSKLNLLAFALIAASLALNLAGLYAAYQYFGWVWA